VGLKIYLAVSAVWTYVPPQPLPAFLGDTFAVGWEGKANELLLDRRSEHWTLVPGCDETPRRLEVRDVGVARSADRVVCLGDGNPDLTGDGIVDFADIPPLVLALQESQSGGGDVNGDGVVDYADSLPTATAGPADLNGDLSVDYRDVLLFARMLGGHIATP
jgi:hypothetical protein